MDEAEFQSDALEIKTSVEVEKKETDGEKILRMLEEIIDILSSAVVIVVNAEIVKDGDGIEG